MAAALEQQVWQRARHCCEYCQIPQELDESPFQIDHIVARKHGGLTEASNLALSCFHDNSHKGPNIAARDARTGKLVPLFNPRRHKWARHFRWHGAKLVGRTTIGRATIAVLNMNDPLRVELREGLIAEGLFPPS
jgi:HNH endonuclease